MFVINAGKYYICKNNSHLKIIFRHSCIFFKKLAGRTLNCREPGKNISVVTSIYLSSVTSAR